MTFSIVAVDKENEEVGFAIASCSWDAGQVVFARAGIGAIASQAKGNLDFLSRYFELYPDAPNLDYIIDAFREEDPDFETRQIGLASFDHAPTAFTGSKCSSWAGHRVGQNCACQGNILVGSEVIEAMIRTFESSDGALYERLFSALQAGDASGGDLRGRQSARLCVKKRGWGQPGTDTLIDIAIPDNDCPVAEMARILEVRGHLVTILGKLSAASSGYPAKDAEVLDELRTFLSDKREPRYLDWWETLADRYYELGSVDRAVQAYEIYLEINPALRTVLAAAIASGELPTELAHRLGLLG